MANNIVKTKDHETIRRWAEARDGHPAIIESTEAEGAGGVLRIDFGAPEHDEELREISWDDFFNTFDLRDLHFVYREQTPAGEPSRFCRFVWS